MSWMYILYDSDNKQDACFLVIMKLTSAFEIMQSFQSKVYKTVPGEIIYNSLLVIALF